MEVTVSDKYQLVVPKAARKKLGIKPGQKIRVKQVSETTITFERQLTMQELLDKAAGSMRGTPWQEEGVDAASWLRRSRDEDWD